MRVFSRRERILFALVTIGLFIPTACMATYTMITEQAYNDVPLWLGLVSLWAGVLLGSRIALSGSATRGLNKDSNGETA